MASDEIGKYGPLVIGEEQFAKEQAVIKKAENVFGPLVTGDSDPEPKKEAPVKVVKDPEPKKEDAPKDPDPDPDATGKGEGDPEGEKETDPGKDKAQAPPENLEEMSVDEVKKALAANTNLVDTLFDAEMSREGQRIGALEAMIKAEGDRTGGARGGMLEKLNTALEQARNASAEG